jgi:hypothetical protein
MSAICPSSVSQASWQDGQRLILPACASIVLAVFIAMVGFGITNPDAGNTLAVRPGVPFVKGLGPILNIILAYSKTTQ